MPRAVKPRSGNLKLELPTPHPGQLKIIGEAKRFNVLCCGRRFGKTVLGLDRLIQPALQGLPVSWFAPNYKLLLEPWRDLKGTLGPVVKSVNEQEHRIELLTGGAIDFWTLNDPETSCQGRKYKRIVVDEAARVSGLKDSWEKTIRPTLTDYKGDAWLMSTPKGINYFKELFDRGQDGLRDTWASWQMPTQANPHIDPEEIEDARQDMTEAAFNQEYLAQFVSWEGSVFRRVTEAVDDEVLPTGAQPGHEYVVGGDWGRSRDYTVFVVVDLRTRRVVDLDRSNQVDYAVQRGRLKALVQRWKPQVVILESNSIGQPIIEQLERDGLSITSFNTSNSSKAAAIESLALAFEQGTIKIPNHTVLLSELLSFQSSVLPSGMIRYAAPGDGHDDCVMALAMAWCGVTAEPQEPDKIYSMADVYPDWDEERLQISAY